MPGAEAMAASYDEGVGQLQRKTGSIVGRSSDIRGIRAALERGRLVNLVGPGGVGKTALATEIINEIEAEFDRTVPVELASAVQAADLRRLLSNELLDDATGDLDRIVNALAATPTLLVLDNCEHLLDDVVEVISTVLSNTNDVVILATSRRPFDVADELVWPVQPLEVARYHGSDRDLVAAGATQLFLERVRQSVPTFELTDANRSMVAKICEAADGVPLVLELAAALVRGRPLDLILEAMTERPAGLDGDRRDRPDHQRSLGASLDWSRRFLHDRDAALLNRLSVFVGGFTAQSARHVDPDGTADGLSRLVDHSLIGFDPDTERYRMLEVVRLDAAERLSEHERHEVEEAHYQACLEIVGRISGDRYAADPDGRFPRYKLELANLGAAFRRTYHADEVERLQALLGPVAVWLVHYMAPEDPSIWVDLFDSPETPPTWHAQILSALSFYWSHRGRHDLALDFAERAVDRYQHADDPDGETVAEISMGNALLSTGDAVGASDAFNRALTTALKSGTTYSELAARSSLARLAPDSDEALLQLTTAQAAAAGYGGLEVTIAVQLASHALGAGRVGAAKALSEGLVDAARSVGYAEVVASALCVEGDVARAEGEPTAARRLYEEALALGRQSVHHGVIERAEACLAGLPDLPAHAPVESIGAETGTDLSDRELAVARLLRGDMTQREIADELYIAPSTVKSHVKSIYRKLGVTKRSYAVTRAAELGLFDSPS